MLVKQWLKVHKDKIILIRGCLGIYIRCVMPIPEVWIVLDDLSYGEDWESVFASLDELGGETSLADKKWWDKFGGPLWGWESIYQRCITP